MCECDSLKVYQVMSMILSDRPTKRADGVIFHSRSFGGDDDGLFELAKDLTSSISANVVIINGGNGEAFKQGDPPAWPGKDYYTKRLGELGCRYFLSRTAPRTLEEGWAFSELAEEIGLKRVVVIAQPFQLLRILQVHLKVMQKRHYPLQIHTMAPAYVDWNKVTHANQGKADVRRFEQIGDELNRLRHGGSDERWKEFQEENLATVGEVIEYLLFGREAL